MKTLQEDIDDLDRMVDTNATKDAIRSQIRLIARELAALEADYSRLAQAHGALQKSYEELHHAHVQLQTNATEKKKQAWKQIQRQADRLNQRPDLDRSA